MADPAVQIEIRAKAVIEDAFKRAIASMDQLKDKTRQTSGMFGSMGSMAQTAIGTMGGFLGAQAIMGGLRGAFSFAMDAAIGMNASLEKSTLQFGTLMGDTKQAEAHVRSLFEFAKATPFETGPVIEASRHMQTFGGNALNTMDNLKRLGDASAATGAPIEQLGFWVGRMYASLKGGQPIGEATMRLMELGVITPETRVHMESLAASAGGGEKAFGLFQASLGKFSGAMVAQANTWDGLMSSISDAIKITLADALRPFFETVKVGAGMLLQVLGSSGVGAAFGALKDSVSFSVGGDSTKLLKSFVSAVLTVGDAFLTVAGIGERIFTFALNGVRSMVYALITTFAQLAGGVLSTFATLAEGAAKLPGVGDQFKGVASSLRGLTDTAKSYETNFRALTVESAKGAVQQSVLSKAIDGSRGILRAVRDEVDRFTPAVTTATTATKPFGAAVATVSKEHAKASETISKLAAEIRMAEKAQFTAKEMTDKFGNAIKAAQIEAKQFGLTLPAEIAKAATAIRNARIAEAYQDAMTGLRKIAQKEFEALIKETHADVKRQGAAFATLTTAYQKVQDDLSLVHTIGIDKRLKELEIKQRDEIAQYSQLQKEVPALYDKLVTSIKEKYARQVAAATDASEDIVAVMQGMGVKTKAQWLAEAETAKNTYDAMKASGEFTTKDLAAQWKRYVDAKGAMDQDDLARFTTHLGAMATAFSQLAQIAGGAFKGIAAAFGTVLAAMDAGGKAGVAMKNGFTEMGKGGKAAAGGALEFASGLMGAVGAMAAATNSTSTAQNVIGGVTTGMKTGMAIAGPWGAAVGAAIGLVVGVIRRPEHGEIMKDLGRQWGMKISAGLAKQIEADSKTLFGKDRVAGSIFNLDKVIEEAGGLNSKNYDKFIGKLRDVFSMIEIGTFSVQQGRDVLDKNFGLFAADMEKSTGLASAKMLELMALNDHFGTNSKAMADFVVSHARSALAGLQTFAKHAQVTTQESAAAMGGALGALFQKMVTSGVPLQAALKEFEPIIDSLRAQFAKAGLDGGAAFDGVTRMVDFMKDKVSGPAVTAVLGLNDVFKGLHNTGLLNQEMFGGLTGQVTETFASLLRQGKDGNQALGLMQPTLQTIWRLQKDFGYEVDAGTQTLLNQAEAAGIVGDKQRDAQDRIATAMDRVVSILELMGRKMGALPKDAASAAEGIDKAFGAIKPKITVAIKYDDPGFDGEDRARRKKSGGDEGYRDGGIVHAGAGRRVTLHGREAVIPLDRPSPIGAQFVRELVALAPSPAAPGQAERFDRLERAVASLAGVMASLPGDLARAYRDSQLQLGRAR